MENLLRLLLNICRVAVAITLPVIAAPALEDSPASTAIAQERKFKLVGTAVVDGPEGSMAVVEIDGRHQAHFRIGDKVGSVLIKQILPDRIIVDTRDGEKIVQLLHNLMADPQKRSDETLSHPLNRPLAPRPSGSRSLQVVRLDQRAREHLLGEVNQALKEVFVEPVIVYGQPVGVRISPIKPGSIFSKIGLQQGDVILEVKGKEVTNPKNAVALFDLIGQGGEFDIKVKGRRTRRIHIITE